MKNPITNKSAKQLMRSTEYREASLNYTQGSQQRSPTTAPELTSTERAGFLILNPEDNETLIETSLNPGFHPRTDRKRIEVVDAIRTAEIYAENLRADYLVPDTSKIKPSTKPPDDELEEWRKKVEVKLKEVEKFHKERVDEVMKSYEEDLAYANTQPGLSRDYFIREAEGSRDRMLDHTDRQASDMMWREFEFLTSPMHAIALRYNQSNFQTHLKKLNFQGQKDPNRFFYDPWKEYFLKRLPEVIEWYKRNDLPHQKGK